MVDSSAVMNHDTRGVDEVVGEIMRFLPFDGLYAGLYRFPFPPLFVIGLFFYTHTDTSERAYRFNQVPHDTHNVGYPRNLNLIHIAMCLEAGTRGLDVGVPIYSNAPWE